MIRQYDWTANMIGQVRGTLLHKQPPHLMLEANGLGYEIDAPMTTFYQLPELGAEISLFTHFVVREDVQALYGFYRRAERDFFRRLIKVNGVGPKLALNFLSGLSIEESIICIESEDVVRLTKLPGVGKKTAERLIIEMRDWLKSWDKPRDPNEVEVDPTPLLKMQLLDSVVKDAESALVALGYRATDAKRAIMDVKKQAETSEEMIRLALKAMA